MIQWPPKVAVVTGASSGIGAELARQLVKQGVAVGLLARRFDRLKAQIAEIAPSGSRAMAIQVDVRHQEQVLAGISEIETSLGPIDLLIANAGVGIRSTGKVIDVDAVKQMVETNLIGALYAIEAVLPGMLDRNTGHLVGVSSMAAYRGLPGSAGYCATKAGLSALLESLRVDLRPRGIGVTTVHPGYVATPMTADAGHHKPFEIDAVTAARIILKGVRSGRAEINFPWRMEALMGLIRRLPNCVYDPMARAIAPKQKPPTDH